MKLIKQAAFPIFVFIIMLGLTSCESDQELKKTTDYSRQNIALTGAQETPATPSTALGSMNVSYSKETKILNWSVNWSGLTGPVTLMHIHGLAPIGFSAGVVQNIITASNGLATPNATLYPATGKFSGTLQVDGILVKEQELLNGMYYMNIHTAAYPAGEIRGQIVFQ